MTYSQCISQFLFYLRISAAHKLPARVSYQLLRPASTHVGRIYPRVVGMRVQKGHLYFLPTITVPTRIANVPPYSKTLIDNIFCNSLELIKDNGTICAGITDHQTVFCTSSLSTEQSMEWTGSIRWIHNPVQSMRIWIGLDQKFTNSADSGLDWIQKRAMCITYLET